MKICNNCGFENEDIRQTCELCGADLTKEEHGNGLVIGLLCVLIAVVITAAVAISLVYYNSDSQVYLRAMSKGNSQYDLGNYSEALEYYLTALSVGKKEEEVYLKLAETYIALEDKESALEILEQGNLTLPTSTKISTRLSEYRNITDPAVYIGSSSETDKTSDENGDYTYEEAVEMSENVTFNDSMFTTFAEYSYADYRTTYSLNVRANTDDSMVVEIQNTGITLCYYNTDENPNVVNVAQGVPRSYAKPTVIELSDLSVLFYNYEGAVTGERLSELLKETITASWNEQESRYEVIFHYMDCIVTLETDSDGNILKPGNVGSVRPEEYTTEEETVTETETETKVEDVTVETESQTEEETTTVVLTADVSGYITDAATGSGIEGAAVAFKQSGSTVTAVFTEVDGYYIATVQEGNYVVEVSCEGYITESFEISVVGSENLTFQNLTISQELEMGTIRIVLEWGESPRDLDSHTEGTFSNGNSFHIYYGSKRAGDVDTNCYAELDVDDTSSYGPETTTIYDVDSEFFFYVYNYSGERDVDFSDVTVKVYIGDSLAATYTGPDMSTGIKLWDVFSYSDGVLTTLNTYAALQ